MMSWNCWVSTSCHSSSSSWAHRPRPATAAVADHSSASRSSRSQRRLPSLVRSWLVSVPRCVSKYSSPRHTGTGAPAAASASTWSKNSRRRAELDRAACRRGRRSAPQPLEHLPRRPAAAVAVAERHQRPVAPGVLGEAVAPTSASSAGVDLGVVRVDRREVGEHPRAVDALPPERVVREAVGAVPRQLLGDEAVACRRRRRPAAARPGSRTRRGSTPRCSARRSAPRSSAGRGRSGARCSRRTAGSCRPRPTCPPTGIHCPAATLSAMRANSSGSRWRDPLVLLGLRAREAVVRVVVHQRAPPRRTCGRTCARSRAIGHSHAVSMWAWPVATTRCAPAPAGDGERRRRARRARRPGVAAGGDGVEGPLEQRAGCAARRGSSSGQRAHHARRARRGRGAAPRRRGRRRTRSARSRRYSGSSPAVAGEPSGDGRNCGNDGFDAASTTSVDRPGSTGRPAPPGGAGGCPAPACPSASRTRPSHWNPGESARKPRSTAPRPAGRDHAARAPSPVKRNHVVPHGGPQRSTDGERRQLVERRPGLDVERPALRGGRAAAPARSAPG